MQNEEKILRLIQWNILSKGEEFCNKASFPKVSENSLLWESRKILFDKIFRELNSDIYCLEEVDDFQIFQKEIFDNQEGNYSSHYFSKESNPQGIAIFYKEEKFELLEKEQIFLKSNADNKKSSQFFSVYFFKEKISLKNFCVLITHLKAKKEFEDVRKAQVQHVCDYLNSDKSFLEKAKKFECASFIFCGDFNTEPDSESLKILLNFNFNNGLFEKFFSCYNLFQKEKNDFLECSTFKIREKEYY